MEVYKLFQGLPIKSNWNLIWLKGKKFSPVATAFDFIQTEKERIIGTSLNGLRIRIEVVQNKYALFLLFWLCINLIYYLLSNKSLSFQDFFDAYSVKKCKIEISLLMVC
jgi:hypothetical protein